MFALIGGFLAIAAACVLAAGLLLGRARTVAEVPVVVAPVLDAGGVSSMQRRLGSLGRRFASREYRHKAGHRLDLAGNPGTWTPDRLLSVKGAGLVTGVAFGVLFGSKHGTGVTIWCVLALGALGLFMPDLYVRNLGEKRQLELLKGLPDALDMMTVCVEAGLGFDAALSRVARNLEGPMAEECARVLQEMQFGMSRSDALRSLVNRTDVSELRVFVSAIIQSSELGISIGDVLREQAKQMRISRRNRAEEKAQQLQVKLLFPLISCLLPAMFIVILGPAVMQIVDFFGKAPK